MNDGERMACGAHVVVNESIEVRVDANGAIVRRVLSAAIVMVAVGAFLQTSASADHPNIVWLISEDNSKHFVRLFDEGGAEMPCIESLSRDGLRFSHAFSNAPVCSVARTTLMTGCYAPRIGTHYHRRSVTVPLPDDLKMFPYYLRSAGYYTSNRQKKDYNAVEGGGVWDQSSGRATWRNRAEGQPFFHMQSFGRTHESSLHFGRQRLSQPVATALDQIRLSDRHPDTELFRFTYAVYHDGMRDVDRQIRQVVEQLEEDGVLEETFIFYFGDHGGVLPGSKGYLYEVGVHVPLVVRIPEKYQGLVDQTKGEEVTEFVSFVDFAPTVLSLAGVEIPDQIDGRPFLGTTQSAPDDCAFGHADRFDEKYDLVRSVRRGDMKYILNLQPFYPDSLQNNYRYRMLAYQEWRELYHAEALSEKEKLFFETKPVEALYDLSNDPFETENLIDNPQYQEQADELRGLLVTWMKSSNDLGFISEAEFVRDAAESPVEFGRRNAERIAAAIDLAVAQRLAWNDLAGELPSRLRDDDPLIRQWAANACATHFATLSGKAQHETEDLSRLTEEIVQELVEISRQDPDRMTRFRAAEALALSQRQDPASTYRELLASSEQGVEAALILNSVAMLVEIGHPFRIALTADSIGESVREDENVKRRMEYLEDVGSE